MNVNIKKLYESNLYTTASEIINEYNLDPNILNIKYINQSFIEKDLNYRLLRIDRNIHLLVELQDYTNICKYCKGLHEEFSNYCKEKGRIVDANEHTCKDFERS